MSEIKECRCGLTVSNTDKPVVCPDCLTRVSEAYRQNRFPSGECAWCGQTLDEDNRCPNKCKVIV